MPSTHKIPERTVHECEPCKWHKMIGALYTRLPGCGGYREYECQHPDCQKEWHGPRWIGKTEEQPDWCPLRRQE